jgi:hypothetical protein
LPSAAAPSATIQRALQAAAPARVPLNQQVSRQLASDLAQTLFHTERKQSGQHKFKTTIYNSNQHFINRKLPATILPMTDAKSN